MRKKQGRIREANVDNIYDFVTSYLVRYNSTRKGGIRPKSVRRYFYDRIHELY
jgi:hypothetical protein